MTYSIRGANRGERAMPLRASGQEASDYTRRQRESPSVPRERRAPIRARSPCTLSTARIRQHPGDQNAAHSRMIGTARADSIRGRHAGRGAAGTGKNGRSTADLKRRESCGCNVRAAESYQLTNSELLVRAAAIFKPYSLSISMSESGASLRLRVDV